MRPMPTIAKKNRNPEFSPGSVWFDASCHESNEGYGMDPMLSTAAGNPSISETDCRVYSGITFPVSKHSGSSQGPSILRQAGGRLARQRDPNQKNAKSRESKSIAGGFPQTACGRVGARRSAAAPQRLRSRHSPDGVTWATRWTPFIGRASVLPWRSGRGMPALRSRYRHNFASRQDSAQRRQFAFPAARPCQLRDAAVRATKYGASRSPRFTSRRTGPRTPISCFRE